jgi:hypothetical protein
MLCFLYEKLRGQAPFLTYKFLWIGCFRLAKAFQYLSGAGPLPDLQITAS